MAEPFLVRSNNDLVFTNRHYTRQVLICALQQEFTRHTVCGRTGLSDVSFGR